MKKNSTKSTPEGQKRVEQKKQRRAKRRAVMLGQVEARTKALTKNVKAYQEKLTELQTALEESYVKIAKLTKENINLQKLTNEEVSEESETSSEEAVAENKEA